MAGRDATVSVRCILVVRRLHIQSSRERSEVEHFRELACTAVCEPGGRRYILGCAAGSFIGQYFCRGYKWNLVSVKSPRMPYLNTGTVGRGGRVARSLPRLPFANAVEFRKTKGIVTRGIS